jgi:mRNA interferase MazF
VVKGSEYIPRRGDIVWVDFSPTIGREQAGRRPALVLSARHYNDVSSCVVVCPITRSIKGYMFEVVIPAGAPVVGAVLADQVKSIDWRMRGASFLGRMPVGVVLAVQQAVHLIVDGALE